jgi:putative addiction module component (TIGR02574 family)
MPDLVAELADLGRALAPQERSRLIELLQEPAQALPLPTIEAAWDEEITRRVAAHARGEVQTFSAEEVFAEARRIAP